MNARSQFAVRTLVAAISACFAGGAATAPQAPTVVAGQAGFQQAGNTLTITNTPGTIINWQSFSINRDEVVRFLQQSASSQVLNRVTGIDPSVILGQLQSNGRVLLINPNGVLFGKGAQIDVAGLLVSTLQLKDADFLAGRYKFNDTPGAGGIDNQGTIRTQSGGHVVLIAPKVENSGLIQSPEGQIMLAAGRSVTLADPDKPAIQVEIANRDNTAVNLGTLIAKNVTLYGGIIRNSGLIQATTAVAGENGKIRLQAKYDVENTGTLQASGTQGGDILVQAAEGVARVQGIIEAKGSLPAVNPASAPRTENAGKGGRIEILAPEIVVDGMVDASGTTGGGAVFIGGQYQGGNSPVPTDWSANPALQRASLSLDNPYATSPSVTATTAGSGDSSPTSSTSDQNSPLIPNRNLPTARTTTIGANARIRADGLEEGDGGVIVAWSDDHTTVQGALSARGGANGGNGGLIETSGHHVTLNGIHIDASAPAGKTGKWLIDPVDFTIAVTDGDITGAELSSQLNNADVEILSSNGAVGLNGDINVNDAVSWSANRLTLSAYRDININAVMTATGSASLVLNTGGGGSGAVRVGFDASGAFSGRVEFDRSGSGFLSINGVDYTVINSLADLQGINNNLTGAYALGANINATDTGGWNGGLGFVPIGQGATFSGPFNGLGHTVNQLTINRPAEDFVGLFSKIDFYQRVSNIGVINANITGRDNVGALAGRNDGAVANSYATGSITGHYNVGGLVGFNDASVTPSIDSYIEYSRASVSVSGTDSVGGLVGRNDATGHIDNSSSAGTVSADDNAGGLVGTNFGAINLSYSTASVVANEWAGGLVGYNDGSIFQSYSSGSASGNLAGGLVGGNWANGAITDSYSTASVSGNYAGGLVGSNDGSVSCSYSVGTVFGNLVAGGVAGDSSGLIQGSVSFSTVSGATGATIGGLVGKVAGGYIQGSWNAEQYAQAIGDDQSNGAAEIYVTGLNSAQRTLRSGYVDFDFQDDAWDIQPGEMPTLLGFMPHNQFLGQIDSNWQNARNWSLGHVPLNSEFVIVNYDTPLVSLYSGNSTVKRLDVHSALVVSGGTTRLTVTGDSTVFGGEESGSINVRTGAVMTVNGALVLNNNGEAGVSAGGRIDLGVGASLNIGGNDYVLVRDADQLQAINNDTAGYYAIAVNFDAGATSGWNSGAGFEPLGSSNSFSGFFEGFGHQISNLTINRPTLDGVGLFGKVIDGTVRNIGVVNASIIGRDNVGAVVGELQRGSVDSAYASGCVSGRNAVGGLVGASATYGEATIANSYSTVAVSGNDGVGGLLGVNWAEPGDGIFGLVENSYSTGNVIANSGLAGGLVGANFGHIDNSFYDIDAVLINGSHQVTEAGIYGGQFANWLANNRVLSIWDYLTEDSGGFQIGTLQNLKDALAFVVSGYSFRLTGNLDLASVPGLHIPVLNGGSFDGNGYVVSNLVLNRPGSDNLGFIGESRGAGVTNLGVENVSVVGRNRVGGIVGYNNGGSVEQSYSTGSVSGVDSVGGLIGHNLDGGINNTYSSATVVASGNGGGGLVGSGNGGWIYNSFSNGNVSGTGYLGGLVGSGNANVRVSFWDTERSGQSSSAGGIGLTTGLSKQERSFRVYESGAFDFDNVWEIDEGVSTPRLQIFAGPSNAWVGGADFLWSNAANWSLGHVPLSTERVNIPWLYSDSVVFDLATGSVRRLTSDANFRIGGGSFIVDGNATFSHSLTLDANSTMTVNGQFVLANRPVLATGAKIDLGALASLSVGGIAYGVIRDVNELQAMDGVTPYALATNIDASVTSGWNSGAGFVPINSDRGDFAYGFEGLGHTISNLYINRPQEVGVGLFVHNYGVIRNLTLENVDITGASSVGSLAGTSSGSIDNYSVSGRVSGSSYVGGVVGANEGGNISNISLGSTLTVNGTDGGVGGVAGYNTGGIISNVTSTASVVGGWDVGGVVGISENGWIENATTLSTASVAGGSSVGGLVGTNYYGNTLIDSSSTASVVGGTGTGGAVGENRGRIENVRVLSPATVTGGDYVGGLVGTHQMWDLVVNSSSAATVTGGDYVGGLVGASSGAITNSVVLAAASVTGNDYVGGLVGHIYGAGDGAIIDSSSAARVIGRNSVGGLVGYNEYGVIVNSAVLAPASVTGNILVGGLVGFNLADGSISDSASAASVSGTREVGGLVGVNRGSVSNTTVANTVSVIATGMNAGGLVGQNEGSIDHSSSAASVTGDSHVGGLAGFNTGSISDSASSGSVAGTQYVGGLAGFNQGSISTSSSAGAVLATSSISGGLVGNNQGTITDSFSTGQVDGGILVGGLVGWNFGQISGAYATGSVSGQAVVGGLVGQNSTGGLVTQSSASGVVSGTNSVGGLVGRNEGSITQSSSSGTVVGTQDGVGGLVGGNFGTISLSSSSAAVTGDSAVGGLVGVSSGQISDSYAQAPSVHGNSQLGGLVGVQNGTVSNSYYDVDTTLINGARAVTRYGIYGSQLQDWLNNGRSLDVANYLSQDANGYYQIGSLQNLKDWLAFAELPGAKFRLTADLDLATLSGWNLPVFSGAEIDGGGHTLSHLSVSQPYNSNVGFIGYLPSGSSLHDIGIVNAGIQGDWEVGGLVGWSQGDVARSYVTGAATSIQGTGDVGGLIGWNDGGLSNAHYNIDQVLINGSRPVVTEGGIYGSQFADWLAGGLALNAANYLTTDANGYYQLGSVQNLKDMLGFVDQAGSKFRLTSDIDLSTIPGWFIPVFRGAEIDGAGHVLSNLSVSQPFNSSLGFVGHLLSGGVIRNLGVEGANLSGYGNVGVLAGWNDGSIEATYSTGYVTGGNAQTGGFNLGGLVGYNQGSISNSFSSVTVDGVLQSADSVGGLIGANAGTVTNGYASGVVSGASAIGGLIGYNSGTVDAAAWNTDTSGQSQGIGQDYGTSSLISMTSAQMADSANFAGWDFAGVWAVVGGVPRLQGVGQALTNLWTGLADGHDWFAAGNWSLGHAPTASELVSIPDVAGTTQIDINSGSGFSVRSVTSAEFLFVAGAGTSFLLTEGGALNAGLRIGTGAMLTSSGNLVIGGGNSQIDAGGSLIANAGLNLVSPATLTVDGLLRANTLTTPGILTLRDASQIIVDAVWSHTGTLNVSGAASLSGPLDIDGGNVNLAAGSSLSSSDSAVRWNGGTIAGTGSLDLQGEATLAIDALGSGARVLAGPDIRVDTFDLAAGSVEIQQGALRLPNGGAVAAGRSLTASGGALEIGGAFAIAGDVITQNNATLLASAPVTVQAGGLLRSGGASMRFTDALVVDGTLEAFAGVTRLDGTGTYTHGGTFRSLPGATLTFGAGTHRFGDGSVFDLSGTLVNNGQFSLVGQNSGLTVATGSMLDLGVANFAGNGVLTNLGTVSANGVAFSGRLVNAGTANLRNGTSLASGFYNTGDLNIVSGTVTALGASSELAGGTINLGSGATLEKSGGTLLWSGGTFGGSGTLAFTNGGLIGFSGNGDRILDNANLSFSFTNLSLPSGSLRLQSGNLSFNTTGGNSTLIPVGTELTMAGGTLTNNGPLDVSGLFGLYGGTLAGAGAINMTGGTIDLPANSTVNWTATGAMSNSGTLNLSNRTITNAITNSGTINTTGGLVFTQLFTNQGTVNLNSGTTTFSAGFQQNSGSTKLGTGAGTSANAVAGGSGFNVAGGTLSGSGNLAGDLNVGNGIVSVGFSPGSLNITGNLNLSAGSTTNIELGGTAPGTGYDTIAVSGTANLAGALNVTSYGGYVPAAGSSYNFMNFGSSTGAFGSTNLPAGWAMSMTSASTYLQLLMAAAQAAGVSPLQALIQALAPASGSAGSMASDPGATTMGATSLDFSRVTPNDLATSLMQQVVGVTQVLPSTDFEDLKVCQ